MHRGRSFVVVFVMAAAVACTGGSDPKAEPKAKGEAEPRAEPEVTTQIQVERVLASGAVPGQGPIGVMDGALLGLPPWASQSDNVVVSHDGGRTWNGVELPDRPANLDLVTFEEGFYVDDDVAAIVGRDPTSQSAEFPLTLPQFFVWTSTDGDGWTGHELSTAGGFVGTPTVTAVGPLLVASTSSAEGFNLYTSDDHGSSWQRATVSGLGDLAGKDLRLEPGTEEAGSGELRMVVATQPDAPVQRRVLTSDDKGSTWSAGPCGLDCYDPDEAGGLVRRPDETSTDGGRTWQKIEIEPPLPRDGFYPIDLSSVLEVAGGWLASASRVEGDNISSGMLLRSDDGRTWRVLVPPDRCGDDSEQDDSGVGGPVRFRGRWYVTYRCAALSAPPFGVVYVGDADARMFESIEATERDDISFGDLIVDDDRLIVFEFDRTGLVAVTTIR